MPESQVDRLKKELRFLKESFEAGIISEGEYMKGRRRIETKLGEWGEGVIEEYGKSSRAAKGKKVETREIVAEDVEDEEPKKIEEVEEEDSEDEALQEEVKENVRTEDERDQLKNQINDLQQQLEYKDDEIKDKEKEERRSDKRIEKYERDIARKEEKIQKLKDREKGKSHFDVWKYVSLILVLIIILLFFTVIKPGIKEPIDPTINESIVCNTDADCGKEEGKVVVCLNKGTEEAICQHLTAVEVELMVLNDKNCDNCDTEKTMQVIEQLFPGVEVMEIDYNTDEGRAFYLFYGIEHLPAYIFGEELSETDSWKENERLRASFEEVKKKYILSEESTGSDYEP